LQRLIQLAQIGEPRNESEQVNGVVAPAVARNHFAGRESSRGRNRVQIHSVVSDRDAVMARSGRPGSGSNWLGARSEQLRRYLGVRGMKRIVKDGEREIRGNDVIDMIHPRRLEQSRCRLNFLEKLGTPLASECDRDRGIAEWVGAHGR
jgi:hypothetical protein